VFRYTQGGTPMANTNDNKRLELSADAVGLHNRAWLNPKRQDVQELMHAIDDKDVREQSFMFEITDGEWNEDYTEFRINEVNMDRGDVGPVTYGANPHTLIAARSGELLAAIPDLSPRLAREALERLTARADLTVPVHGGSGVSIALAVAQLEVDKQYHQS
jgi:phage head maturation protease